MSSARLAPLLLLLASVASSAEFELVPVRGFANPEDVELAPPARVLLVSEMGFSAPRSGGGLTAVPWSPENGLVGTPRRLWPADDALPPARSVGDPSCVEPPDPTRFSGHGLSSCTTAEGELLVAMVGHGAREAIEYFEVAGIAPSLRTRWVGCVPLPSGAAGNDLVLEPDGSVLVTNYIPSVHGLRAWIWLQVASLGWNTGYVLGWAPATGWSRLPDSDGSMPNGIVRRAGAIYIAYNGSREILGIYPTQQRRRISLSSLAPDNLAPGPGDTILAAVLHPSSPGAWSVISIDPALERTEVVYSHDGSIVGSATSVAFDGARYYVGSMAGDAIGVLTAAGVR